MSECQLCERLNVRNARKTGELSLKVHSLEKGIARLREGLEEIANSTEPVHGYDGCSGCADYLRGIAEDALLAKENNG